MNHKAVITSVYNNTFYAISEPAFRPGRVVTFIGYVLGDDGEPCAVHEFTVTWMRVEFC